jgi:hypothetical protein
MSAAVIDVCEIQDPGAPDLSLNCLPTQACFACHFDAEVNSPFIKGLQVF